MLAIGRQCGRSQRGPYGAAARPQARQV